MHSNTLAVRSSLYAVRRQIRKGNGGDPTFGTSDMVAELHPKLMGGMTLFFLAGGQARHL